MQRVTDPTYGPVIERGLGSRLWDTEGRRYFDLTCGYSAANFGHAFPPLVQAAREQLDRLTHLTGMSHPGRAKLAELLIQHCGRDGDRVIFNTSGARAVETAIKVARTHRPGKIVSIGAAYHGRSLFTSALSDTPSVGSHEVSGTVRRPMSEMAYCAHCPCGSTYPACHTACADALIEWIEQEHASISAILAEPAYGARGYIAPPAEYWRRVRAVTQRYGIVMIADEIQMGLGRCGHWLLSRAQGWSADLVVLGKSLGGGITPISAVIGPQALINCLPAGSESETFAASPLATAVGIEVMRQLADGPWMQRAGDIGSQLRAALDRAYPSVQTRAIEGREQASDPRKAFGGSTEQLGASASLEFLGKGIEVASAAAAARNLAVSFRQSGLIVHNSGPWGTRIVLLPALTISQAELDEIVAIICP